MTSRRQVPNPVHLLTEPFRRAAAWLLGYFWLPCPLCGRMFAGFQWRDRWGKPSHIPVDGSWSEGAGICPTCTRRGLGFRSAPTVLAPRTAPRGGSTYDGALQVPSGEQFRSDGVTPSPSEPVSHAGTAHHLRGQQSVNPSHGSAAHPRT